MSLFKKYFSIVQESLSEMKDDTAILDNYYLLVNEKNDIISQISFNDSQLELQSFLSTLDKVLDNNSKTKIKILFKEIENKKKDIKKIKLEAQLEQKKIENKIVEDRKSGIVFSPQEIDDFYKEIDKKQRQAKNRIQKIIQELKVDIFQVDDFFINDFKRTLIYKISTLESIITDYFSVNPSPFIKGYILITPDKFLKFRTSEKNIFIDKTERFNKVLENSDLGFSKKQIEEILKDALENHKISQIRAKTMNIGYFFDEISSNFFQKYGFSTKKDIDNIIFTKITALAKRKNLGTLEDKKDRMNTSISQLNLSKDRFEFLINSCLAEAERNEMFVDSYEIEKMTLNRIQQLFPETFEEFIDM